MWDLNTGGAMCFPGNPVCIEGFDNLFAVRPLLLAKGNARGAAHEARANEEVGPSNWGKNLRPRARR